MDKLVYYTSILLDDMFERKGGTRGLVNAFFVNYVIMIIEAIFFLYDDGDRGWDEKRKKLTENGKILTVDRAQKKFPPLCTYRSL